MPKITPLSVPAAALAVTLLLAGCEPRTPPRDSDPPRPPFTGCRAEFVKPWGPHITPGGLIRGDLEARCHQPPAKHAITVTLERQSPSGWQVKDKTGSTAIPSPAGFTLTVITECSAGRWRLNSTVQVTWPNGEQQNPGAHSDQLFVRSANDCKETR